MAQQDFMGKALKTLVNEAFHGSPPEMSWFTNPGDGGLLGLLGRTSAAEASTEPGPGRRTIAAHSAHILYHLELIDRVMSGDYDAFKKADWKAAWKNQVVNDAEWKELIEKIRALADKWIAECEHVDRGDEMMLTGSMASPVHFALHFGAINQILLTVRYCGGPQ